MSEAQPITVDVTPGSVLQPWVMRMGWKLQSILLSGFRGPDHPRLPHVKAVNRWLRRVSQNNADPSKDYMREDTLPSVEEVEAELEYLPCHFVHHFADSLRVVAIHHPEHHVRMLAATPSCGLASNAPRRRSDCDARPDLEGGDDPVNHSTPREPDLTTNQLDYLRGILEAHQVPDPLRRIFARARLTETGQMIGATKYQRGLRDALVALHGVIRDVEVRKSLRAELGLLAVNEAAREGR